MKVRLSDRAERDLEEIADFIAEDSPDRAVSFVQELLARCFALADFPEAAHIWQRRSDRTIRRTVHGNYLIFYTIEEQTVRIQRIVHGARNLRRLL